jgi:hypothetical protein
VIAALLYVTLSTAAYYLASRAKITSWLWSRYPARVEYFALCAACSGLWYGAAAALAIGRPLDLPLLGLPADLWLTPIVAGAVCMVWTPIVAAIMVRAWMDLMETDDDGPPETQ